MTRGPDRLPDTMSYELFHENEEKIVAEVRTILLAKGKTRRRFRILAIYEQSSDSLVGEVLRTSFGPVVAFRAAATSEEEEPAGGGAILIGFRQDRKHPAIAPFTGEQSQHFSILSTRAADGVTAHYPLTGADITARTYADDLLVFK